MALTQPTVHLTVQSRVLAALIGLAFIISILELIRRHKLQERYTALWLLVGVGFVLCAIFPQLLTVAADVLGVRDTNVALFVVLIGGLVLVVLHLTVVISQQSEQITRLAQEVAISRSELEDPRAAQHLQAEMSKLDRETPGVVDPVQQ
jgi:hypothetical protein